MSGPPYPRPPAGGGVGPGGDTGIGTFIIGVSPVGWLPKFDYWTTILIQYANSDIITKLIGDFFSYVDQTANFQNFFDLMWNVYTAQGYGLDCWGTIVGANRVLKLATGPKYVGFDEGGTLDYDSFGPGGESPWYSGQKLTTNYIMTDDGFRTLIFAKALSNICDGGIPTINRIMRLLFGSSGRCYVVDNADTTLVYKFEFTPTAVQLAILTQSGVMPTPTGWAYTVETP